MLLMMLQCSDRTARNADSARRAPETTRTGAPLHPGPRNPASGASDSRQRAVVLPHGGERDLRRAALAIGDVLARLAPRGLAVREVAQPLRAARAVVLEH